MLHDNHKKTDVRRPFMWQGIAWLLVVCAAAGILLGASGDDTPQPMRGRNVADDDLSTFGTAEFGGGGRQIHNVARWHLMRTLASRTQQTSSHISDMSSIRLVDAARTLADISAGQETDMLSPWMWDPAEGRLVDISAGLTPDMFLSSFPQLTSDGLFYSTTLPTFTVDTVYRTGNLGYHMSGYTTSALNHSKTSSGVLNTEAYDMRATSGSATGRPPHVASSVELSVSPAETTVTEPAAKKSASNTPQPPAQAIPEAPLTEPAVYLTVEEMKTLIAQFFPPDVPVDLLLRIAGCESTGSTKKWRTNAHRTSNPGQTRTGDFGVFQVNYIWLEELQEANITERMIDLLNPEKGIAAAAHVWSKQGKPAWAASEHCWKR